MLMLIFYLQCPELKFLFERESEPSNV